MWLERRGEHINSQILPQLLTRPTLVLLYCLFEPQRMDRDVVLCPSGWIANSADRGTRLSRLTSRDTMQLGDVFRSVIVIA